MVANNIALEHVESPDKRAHRDFKPGEAVQDNENHLNGSSDLPSSSLKPSSSSALLEMDISEESNNTLAPSSLLQDEIPQHLHTDTSAKPKEDLIKVAMDYNKDGELVHACVLQQKLEPEEMSVTQLIRAVNTAYRHEIRSRLGKIMTPHVDGMCSVLVDNGTWRERLSSWDFRSRTSNQFIEKPMGENHSVAVYRGPPRVLEIGCSNGSWCFNFKREQPDWIVEGIDDTDRWSRGQRGIPRDFVRPRSSQNPEDAFSGISTTQKHPEFMVRNVNSLLAGPNPLPHNLYEFIRAWEIFDKVESYKSFLEDIRLLLKPNGVVEFLMVDPRPRTTPPGSQKHNERHDHKSGPMTNLTDKIADRFKDPFDGELATNVQGWSARVEQRLKANLRPHDGVPAANLKSWLEGAGFWDVKQRVIQWQVGGSTQSGQLLKDFILYQVRLEDDIPKLRDELPMIEMKALESGSYYLNLHVVTGRKPPTPRPGDLLIDGTRQEMTVSKYDAMARHEAKSSQWKRFDLEGKLSITMQDHPTLISRPESPLGTREVVKDEIPFPQFHGVDRA